MPVPANASNPGPSPAPQDLGPLAWVIDEIQKTLDGAGKALRRFAREAATEPDTGPLRLARQQLHQAVGALTMVGHKAPALVVGAMEFAVQRYIDHPAGCSEAAVQKLDRAGFAVSDYLHALLGGKPVSSVGLFPQYRDVLEMASSDRVHPADLWAHGWRWVEIKPSPTQAALVYDPAVRSKLDREVLKIVKSGDDRAARRLHEICLGLARGSSVPRVVSFWTLAAGFFEALGAALLPVDVYVKRVSSRVLLQYATLARGDTTVSERLGQDLLFFCAQAVPGASDEVATLRQVRASWGIAEEEPAVDYTVEQFGRFDPLVLVQARKRIDAAKEMWSALSAGDVTRTRQVADTFAQLGESLQKLHPPSLPMVQALNNAVDASLRSGTPPSTELGLEVATAVLYLEAAFEDLDPQDRQLTARTVQLAGRIERVRDGGQAEPLEPWMEELYRRVSDRHSMGTVVDELRAHLGELEKSLDQFFRRPAERGALRTVPSQLLQMRGVFSVLGLDQAAQTVQRMRESVDHLLEAASPTDGARDFDSLGNNLGALGFLIDMLGYQPALAKRLFVFDETLGELKPLMGRTAEGADGAMTATGAADAATVAPAAGPVLSVEEVDAQIAAKLAALAAPTRKAATPIEEFSRAADTWTAKIVGPTALPDTEVNELDEDDLQNIFLDEAREVLENGNAAVSLLGEDPTDTSELTVLRRAFHTLKGSSRMVGLTAFGDAAWAFEQVLNTWLADQRPATPELLSATERALKDFSAWVEAIAAGQPHSWEPAAFSRVAEALRSGDPLPPPAAIAPDALAVAARHIAAEAPPAPLPVVDEASPAPEWASEIEAPELSAVDVVDAPVAAAPADEALAARGASEMDDDFASTDFLDFGPRAEAPVTELPPPLGGEDIDFLETAHASIEQIRVPTMTLDFDLSEPAPLEAPVEARAAPAPVAPAPAVLPPLPDLSFATPAAAPAPTEMRDEPDAAQEELDALASLFAAPPEPELRLDDVAPAAAPVAEVLPVFDVVEAAPVALAASPATEPEPEPAFEPAAPSADDAVKAIGPLRIGIALYNVYLNEADEWSRQLAIDVGEWALEPHLRIGDSTVALAHSLAGSSATVGFQGLSGMARLFETALQHLHRQGRGTAEQGRVLVAAADEVRHLLHQFAAGFLREPSDETLQDLRDVAASQLPLDAPDSGPAPLGFASAARADVSLDDSDDAYDLVDSVDLDLFPIFEEEAAELMPKLGGALRDWLADPASDAPRASVLRTLHTLKGSARLAGAMRLGERAHRMESEIEAIGAHGADRADVEALLVRFDALQSTFDGLRDIGDGAGDDPVGAEAPVYDEPLVAPVSDAATPVASPETTAANESPAEAPVARTGSVAVPLPSMLMPLRNSTSQQAVRIRTQLLDRLVAQAGEVIITRSRLEAELNQLRGSLGDLTGNLDRLRQQLRDIEVQAESQMQSRLAQAKDSQQGFDPLEFDRFTRVQELTRMMAESVNDVATVQRTLQKTVQATEDDLSAQARQTRELQRGLLRTRMVEFEGISDRLYRVVRQASKDTGKQVRLDIVGGSIEMDRGLLERMTPAFEHLLRNSVAHGIENAAAREQAGKEPSGLIAIELHQEGNDVSVSFRDDGGGLNLERIAQRARALGLAAEGEVLSPEAAAEMIFKPGFSTAEQVSELAGRGIGMDVVRADVAALGGRIETHSTPGHGTTFKLVMPLTTAVTHVVMLRAGNTSIGVPSNLVELVQRVSAAELDVAYASQQYLFAGGPVPFYWAGALLQSSARSEASGSKTHAIVVVRSAAQRVALHVDEVLGNQEVVVKNLGPQLSRLPGMAGISVLASGAVALIYNPVALAAVHGDLARAMQQAGRVAAAAALAAGQGGASAAIAPVGVQEAPLVLVVDDSITVRRVTQRMLQREGYRVSLAADGLQALERLQTERPAVVLSDIEMPRMDGFDLARNIRADEALAHLPIIMITSRIAEKHREHAAQLGVNHYLGKPYSEEELLRLVRTYAQVEAPATA